jgi:putative membrane protein
MIKHLIVFAKGFCMGTADVIPGVSGGTMAFILGIYTRLLEAIRAFDWQLLAYLSRRQVRLAIEHVDLVFLLFLGAGIAAALLFFTRVISLPGLLQTHPEQVYGLFFGLIAASVVLLFKSLSQLGSKDVATVLAGIALGWAIVNLVPVETPQESWFLFLSGALAICAMILPGISGAFILLILNKYAYVLDAIGRIDLSVLAPFGLGAVIGLMLFSRVLVWLLHHYYKHMVLGIAGILIGSLWMMWPFQERTYELVRDRPRLVHSAPIWPDEVNMTVLAAIGCMIAGIVVVLSINALAGTRRLANAQGFVS